MIAPDQCRSHTFGPTRFCVPEVPLERLELLTDRGESRKALRQACPNQAGVYGMWDADGELIYVGKAKRLRTRLLTYFGARQGEEKAHRILSRAHTIAWERTPDEFGALVRELELIRRWRPRFNVQGQPGRASRGFICLGRSPAPYFYLAAAPTSRTLAVFGPVSMGGRSREAVRRLNDLFQLRDCTDGRTMAFADQRELFAVEREGACMRHELGTCVAPCIGACTRRQYSSRVNAARAFLSGEDSRILDRLEREMRAAAFDRRFEVAAHLRDTCDVLHDLVATLDNLKHVRAEYFFIYPASNDEMGEIWYLVRGGNVICGIEGPRCQRTALDARRMIEKVFNEKQLEWRADDYSETLLTAAWFRRNPEEIERTIAPIEALRKCEAAIENGRLAQPV